MSLPREPRQKMINMMYLVLTALLALNVSAEILNAFKTVNTSLETTNVTVNNSTNAIMTSLEEKLTDPKTAEKAQLWLPKAQQVQSIAKAAYTYIQTIKDDIIKQGGGNVDKASFKADNLDIATRLMVDKGKGKELLKKLSEFKADVLKVDPSIDSTFANTLPINLGIPKTQSKSNNTWERAYFHMVPTVAALTILSKFQNDVKTSENKIVEFCHNKVGAVVVRFDTYNAFAATSSNYVMPGDDLEVMAGVGAFSKAALPEITIDGSSEKITEDGAAHRKMKASDALGKHTINVNIKYKDQDGKDQTVSKLIEYTVGQSAASIALDKMNVLYIGVDNPITISTTGGGSERVEAAMTGAGGNLIKNGGGRFTARPNQVTDECWITVTVDGKTAGKSKFRVRTIPTPIATVGGVFSNENMTVGQFQAQSGVGAFSPNFPFDLKYAVTSFTFVTDNDDGDLEEAICQGNTWNDKAQGLIRKLKAGRTVSIENIRAVGPDGMSKKLPGLTYYIK
ncbi:MAG TPA: gliding motility protein GldM [Chitinophagaceae bacterium]|nr:gliding motility protein GldM [Chitinophagaceae bacterium]